MALLSLSAIYDWGGPDHVSITPIIGEMALAIDLHRQPPDHLSREEKDRRRILFWGIYTMDQAGGWGCYIADSSRWESRVRHVL